jgi:hypothetical protein
MCVILIAESRRLSNTLIDAAVQANPDGNGFAWINDDVVVFEKGITVARVKELARSVPMPYVFHARIATVGGKIPELCHPFTLNPKSNALATRGKSKAGVLFHNGHWHDWEEYVDVDKTAWSDTRAMAAIVKEYDVEALYSVVPLTQKTVVMTPEKVHIRGNWIHILNGVRASNGWFLRERVPSTTSAPAKKTTSVWLGSEHHEKRQRPHPACDTSPRFVPRFSGPTRETAAGSTRDEWRQMSLTGDTTKGGK